MASFPQVNISAHWETTRKKVAGSYLLSGGFMGGNKSYCI
jgi:hypothetical protein